MTVIQVLSAGGVWKQLPLSKGQVAVLAGHTLERATCGLVKAATHRVVCELPWQVWLSNIMSVLAVQSLGSTEAAM